MLLSNKQINGGLELELILELMGESSKCVLKTTLDQRKKADFKVISSLLLAYGLKVDFK